ncbi:DNA-binding protein [Pandoraea terrigena]|uniref:DNA-binding protein n=2 Tax=Pandoraea terrigena TaxID=2508292 RepID=A0A5E4RV78_9BURK|nr:DNA-binding protein [Pandoraea terrigena]
MRTDADFSPNWAVPPGRTVSDLMALKSIAEDDLARSMQMTTDELSTLLDGRHPLTPPIASRLEGIFGAPIGFWLSREQQYREQLAEFAKEDDIADDASRTWLRSLPVKQMMDFGWIRPVTNKTTKFRECLEFFGVSSLAAWNQSYSEIREAAAFRTTAAHVEDDFATAAWLRWGEVVADKTECQRWDPRLFEALLPEIRELTLIPAPSEFLPRLKLLCAKAGVAVVVAKPPSGCRASGATFFSTPEKAVLMLSFRYLRDDQFWFSFFHEAGHLVLHYDTKSLILETSREGPQSALETEANRFAEDVLLTPELQRRLPEAAKSLIGIVRLARDAGVSKGIVVGQMQHRGLVKQQHFNNLKVKYRWS